MYILIMYFNKERKTVKGADTSLFLNSNNCLWFVRQVWISPLTESVRMTCSWWGLLNLRACLSLLAVKICHVEIDSCRPSSLIFWSGSWVLQQSNTTQFYKLSVNIHNHKQTRRRCESDEGCSLVVGVLTDSQLPQAAFKLRFLLQDPQQVGGLHVLQLHLPVDVDFVTEAHVNQTGAVLSLLTCVLTCEDTRNINNIRVYNRKLLLIMLWFSVSCEYRWTHQQSFCCPAHHNFPLKQSQHPHRHGNQPNLPKWSQRAGRGDRGWEGRNSVGAKKQSAVETGGSNKVSCLFL